MSIESSTSDGRDAKTVVVALIIADADLRRRVRDALREVNIAEALSPDDADVLVSDSVRQSDRPFVVIGDRATVKAALQQGAAGGLRRPNFRADQLGLVIAAAAMGLTCSDLRPATVGITTKAHALSDEPDAATPPLTARETEVMALLTSGASNKQIARRLDISVHTAKFHVAAIIAKLGATGRTDAVARALAARFMV